MHAPGDHDLRALAQRLRHREGPEVDVGALHLRADRGERLAGLHVFQFHAAAQRNRRGAAHDVVARDGGHAHFDSLALGDFENRIAASLGIHSAGVGDHANAPLLQIRQHAGDHVHEIARVSGLGIARALLLQNRHGDFGQIVERQIVDGSAPHLFHGRFERIAPEPLPIGDANHLLHNVPPVHRGARSAILRRSAMVFTVLALRKRRSTAKFVRSVVAFRAGGQHCASRGLDGVHGFGGEDGRHVGGVLASASSARATAPIPWRSRSSTRP